MNKYILFAAAIELLTFPYGYTNVYILCKKSK